MEELVENPLQKMYDDLMRDMEKNGFSTQDNFFNGSQVSFNSGKSLDEKPAEE